MNSSSSIDSLLRPDELIEQGDTASLGHRDGKPIHPAGFDAQSLARLDEQPLDVL
jgi:hypothetical protein